MRAPHKQPTPRGTSHTHTHWRSGDVAAKDTGGVGTGGERESERCEKGERV